MSTAGLYWKMTAVTNMNTFINGVSTNLINLFNNGQIISGITAPLNWVFTGTPTTAGGWRTNCRLTTPGNNNTVLP